MIDYTCQHCGERMSSPDSLAGQPDTCPACNRITTVPHAAAVVRLSRRTIITAFIVVGTLAATLAWGLCQLGGDSVTMGDAVRARNLIGASCRDSGPPDGSTPMRFFLAVRPDRIDCTVASVEGIIEAWHYASCIAVIPVSHDMAPAVFPKSSQLTEFYVSPDISRTARRILAGESGLSVIFVATRIVYTDGDVEVFPPLLDQPDRSLAAAAYIMNDTPVWRSARRFHFENMFQLYCYTAGTPDDPSPLEFLISNGSGALTTSSIKGNILVYDQHGDCVAVIPAAYDKPLALGERALFEIDWYVDARTRDLLVGNISGRKLVFAVSSVIYADGSREIFRD